MQATLDKLHPDTLDKLHPDTQIIKRMVYIEVYFTLTFLLNRSPFKGLVYFQSYGHHNKHYNMYV